MNVEFIWITNYKSINERNKLVIDPSVTAVIGKNESGKSNLIDIIGSVSFTTGIQDDIYSKTTQGVDSAAIKVEVECSFSKVEINRLGIEENKMSKFTISQDLTPYKVAISGAVSEYFKSDSYQKLVQTLESMLEKYLNGITGADTKKSLTTWIEYLKSASEYIIGGYAAYLTNITKRLSPIVTDNEKEKLIYSSDSLKLIFSKMYDTFPIFHQYRENQLLNQYQINKEFFEKDSSGLESLTKLVTASNCTIEDLRDACLDNPHNGKGMDAKRRIEKGVRDHIEKGFNEFYKQDGDVELVVDLKPNRVSLYVNTTGPTIALSERSNGLRWYLNVYIDILANDLKDRQVVYLIDEPGVYLHVDAQKKVLQLFDNLSKTNQVIYTTHSPFMLDENRIDRIRAMQKGDDGFSEIITSVMSGKILDASHSETLSPLVNALGMRLHQNLGMSEGMVNVVTEGFTDAIYLRTMAKMLGFTSLKFIPSAGASKVVHIANILWGWGMPYKTLFDWDKAGRDGRNTLVKAYSSNIESVEANEYILQHVVMISDVIGEEFDEKEYYTTESLIDEKDYQQLGMSYSPEEIDKSGNLKMLCAKNFADQVSLERITLSKKTIANFTFLFNKLHAPVPETIVKV